MGRNLDIALEGIRLDRQNVTGDGVGVELANELACHSVKQKGECQSQGGHFSATAKSSRSKNQRIGGMSKAMRRINAMIMLSCRFCGGESSQILALKPAALSERRRLRMSCSLTWTSWLIGVIARGFFG